jgi:integrase/recombinase XerD
MDIMSTCSLRVASDESMPLVLSATPTATTKPLFDHADDEVERIGKSGRKGWQAAYRDAVMMKVAYAYGLRFNELRHLQTVDFARNPHAREFGAFGVCKVRYGKARRGSPHKPRSVLTVWRWTPGIVEDWLANGRGEPGTLDLFSSERGGLVVESTLIRRVRRYCEELGFSDGLDLHSFRRSYATHLLEAGWDPRFVQDQMGHEHASTTGIYQFVSDELRRSTLRSALDRTVKEAMARGIEDGTS